VQQTGLLIACCVTVRLTVSASPGLQRDLSKAFSSCGGRISLLASSCTRVRRAPRPHCPERVPVLHTVSVTVSFSPGCSVLRLKCQTVVDEGWKRLGDRATGRDNRAGNHIDRRMQYLPRQM
jgi:hypothetical protein